MKRMICLVLALVMLCSLVLVGCSGDTDTKTGGSGGGPGTVDTAADPNDVYDVPIKKLNREIVIIRRDAGVAHLTANEIYSAGINGEKINDAVYARNSRLQDLYGVTFKDATYASSMQTSLTAGDYLGDVIFYTLYGIRSYANAGLLVDWSSLENINLEKNWWNHNLTKNVNIGGKVFFITGDAATLDDRATWVLSFNKTLVENAQLESPYKLIEKNEWTVDKMVQYMTALSEDRDDDGKTQTLGVDIVAYTGDRFSNWAQIAGAGHTLSDIGPDGSLVIPDAPKREILDAIATLKPLLTHPGRYCYDVNEYFLNGTAAFNSINLASIVNFPDSSINFGFVPYPKMNSEQQGYYTAPSHAQFGVFVMPKTVANDERRDWEANGFSSAEEQVAYFMEAFAYHSIDTVKPAFYDQVLLKQTAQDVESRTYLEMILDPNNIILDPLVLFNFGSCGYTVFYLLTPTETFSNDLTYENFTSNYESRVDGARTALAEYLLIQELL